MGAEGIQKHLSRKIKKNTFQLAVFCYDWVGVNWKTLRFVIQRHVHVYERGWNPYKEGKGK